MDILSFITGMRKGKSSIKLQEKRATPGTVEKIVVPDTGFDALSKVIVEAAQAGGSGEWVGATGQFTPTGDTAVVEHGLGAVPDIVIITYNDSNALSTSLNKMVLLAAAAYSSNVLNNVTMNAAGKAPAYGFSSSIHANTKMVWPASVNAPLENLTSSSAVGIGDATSTTVTFGSTSFNAKLAANGKAYVWYAFAKK